MIWEYLNEWGNLHSADGRNPAPPIGLKLDHFDHFMAPFQGLKLESHPKNHGMNKPPINELVQNFFHHPQALSTSEQRWGCFSPSSANCFLSCSFFWRLRLPVDDPLGRRGHLDHTLNWQSDLQGLVNVWDLFHITFSHICWRFYPQ